HCSRRFSPCRANSNGKLTRASAQTNPRLLTAGFARLERCTAARAIWLLAYCEGGPENVDTASFGHQGSDAPMAGSSMASMRIAGGKERTCPTNVAPEPTA